MNKETNMSQKKASDTCSVVDSCTTADLKTVASYEQCSTEDSVLALKMDEKPEDQQYLFQESCAPSKFESVYKQVIKDNNSDITRINEEPNDIVLDAGDSISIPITEQLSFEDSQLVLMMNELSIIQKNASDKCNGADTCNSVNDVSLGDFNATTTYKQCSSQDLSANLQKVENVSIKGKSLKIVIKKGFNYLNNCQFNMNDHLKSSPDRKKLFKSNIYPQPNLHRGNLNEHKNLKHGTRETFECDTCSKSFPKKSYIIDHIRVVHGEKQYQCTFCHKSFALKKILKNHMSVHINDQLYACGICSKPFKRKGCLKVHIDQHQRGTRRLSCTFANCPKSYKSKGGLNKHIASHKISKRFECQECRKLFPYKNQLKAHINTVHEEKKPFVCDKCGKSFGQKANLARHENIHEDIKAFNCDDCGKSFRQKSHIEDHIIRVHESESFNCDICDKSFKQESRLKTHLNNIHYPSKSFKCDICNKLYSSKSALKKHTNNKHKQVV